VNLLGDLIDNINKYTETLTDASKKIGLEVKVDKTNYIMATCEQNAGQIRDIKIGNR
jgi:hypothetical protein